MKSFLSLNIWHIMAKGNKTIIRFGAEKGNFMQPN